MNQASIWLACHAGNGIVERFIEKLLNKIAAGHVKQAILLTDFHTETKWWRRADAASSAMCFPTKQIDYWSVNGAGVRRSPGTAFYFGRNAERFRTVFKEIAHMPRDPV